MSSPRELVELYTALGRRVLAQGTTDGAFAAVTGVAVEAVGRTSYASISRGRGDGFQTLGATHPDATANDQLQYDLGSGPCVDAAATATNMIVIGDLARDARYPVFGPRAAANGAASMLSVRMVFEDDDLRASLNLYSRERDAFDDTAQTVAMVMATHGAVAVAGVIAREHAVNLERALANSREIGMAVGILMSSMTLSTQDAFTLLRIASQTQNRKLSAIAADVVLTGSLEMPPLP